MDAWIDAVSKIVQGIAAPAGLLILGFLNYRLARRATSQTPHAQEGNRPRSLRETAWLVLLIASLSFFVTLLTQYVYPPYGVFAPDDYKPLFNRQTIKTVWAFGLIGLLFLIGVPQALIRQYGAANVRERVAQGLAIGVPIAIAIVVAAFLLRR